MVDEAVHCGDRHNHNFVREDPVPGSKGMVGRHQQAAPLVAGGDEFEQDRGLGLVTLNVGQVIEHEQVVAVELADRGLELECLACGLQALDEVGGSGEQWD